MCVFARRWVTPQTYEDVTFDADEIGGNSSHEYVVFKGWVLDDSSWLEFIRNHPDLQQLAPAYVPRSAPHPNADGLLFQIHLSDQARSDSPSSHTSDITLYYPPPPPPTGAVEENSESEETPAWSPASLMSEPP